MTNNINIWFGHKKKEAVKRYAPNGLCQKCGNPLAVSMDDFGIFCKRCGWVRK